MQWKRYDKQKDELTDQQLVKSFNFMKDVTFKNEDLFGQDDEILREIMSEQEREVNNSDQRGRIRTCTYGQR